MGADPQDTIGFISFEGSLGNQVVTGNANPYPAVRCLPGADSLRAFFA